MWLKSGRPVPGVGDAVGLGEGDAGIDAVGSDGTGVGVAGVIVGIADAVAVDDPQAPAIRTAVSRQAAHLLPAALITPKL
jgi:hypothetical protein